MGSIPTPGTITRCARAGPGVVLRPPARPARPAARPRCPARRQCASSTRHVLLTRQDRFAAESPRGSSDSPRGPSPRRTHVIRVAKVGAGRLPQPISNRARGRPASATTYAIACATEPGEMASLEKSCMAAVAAGARSTRTETRVRPLRERPSSPALAGVMRQMIDARRWVRPVRPAVQR